jgi:hypothetical protein
MDMRSAVARHPPSVRKIAAPHAARATAVPSVRTQVAPHAIQITGATVGFLIAYAALTVLHAAGREPPAVRTLSSIPLFARIAASAIAALPGGLLLPRILPERAVRLLPALLAIGIALATGAILVWA